VEIPDGCRYTLEEEDSGQIYLWTIMTQKSKDYVSPPAEWPSQLEDFDYQSVPFWLCEGHDNIYQASNIIRMDEIYGWYNGITSFKGVKDGAEYYVSQFDDEAANVQCPDRLMVRFIVIKMSESDWNKFRSNDYSFLTTDKVVATTLVG
jgi:hypothetical protein